MTPDLDELMDFAAMTATAAGRLTREHFGATTVAFKGDGSEITAADTAAEEFIRSSIAERYPDHGIYGEEGARVDGDGRHRWIIDPIDGTRSFASGVPLYGILIGLEVDGKSILGCCHLPEHGDIVVAATGAGCWWDGRPAHVSDCERLGEARLVTSGLEYWRDWATPLGCNGFERLLRRCRFGRTWGDCFGYILVATGRAEILADPACGAVWDYAPILPILTEAGGRLTRLDGRAIAAWSSALATNSRLHAAAIDCWAGAGDESIQTDEIRRRANG